MKRHLRRIGIVGLAVSALALGCGITQRHLLSGRDIDPQIVSQITPGVTTKQEVTDRFGKPDQVSSKPEGEEYLYTYRGVVEKTDELGVYAKKTTTDERKTLRVIFDKDLVKQVSYTNSHNPEENVSKS